MAELNVVITGTEVEVVGNNIIGFAMDNLVNTLTATTDQSEDWSYSLTVHMIVPDLYNVIALTRSGQTLSVDLTDDMLPYSGRYEMQFTATNGELVGHTDIFEVYVKNSLDPGKKYSPVPSEFFQIQKEIEQSEAEAEQSANEAAQSAQTAQTAVNNIGDSVQQAQTEANNAQVSAQRAVSSAIRASSDATQASESASQASNSAISASNDANIAEKSATEAKQSATQAQESASLASESATQASEYESNAANSAAQSQQSASDSRQSALEASQSASQASILAQEAEDSATAAQNAQQAIENMTVTANTLGFGSEATVTKTVDQGVVNLDFGIPSGITPNIQIGSVDTLEPGSDATASITGTVENPLINLGIPRGQNGKTPEKGIDYFTEADVQELAEKAAALVIGEPKLLAEETMEEEAIPILDIGDVASNYSLIRVYITVPKVESTFQSFIVASVPKSTTGIAYNMAQVKLGNTSGESFVFLEFWPLIYRGICKRGLAYGPLTTASITSEMQYVYNSYDYNRLKSARYVRTSAALPTGSTISIYGVKR